MLEEELATVSDGVVKLVSEEALLGDDQQAVEADLEVISDIFSINLEQQEYYAVVVHIQGKNTSFTFDEDHILVKFGCHHLNRCEILHPEKEHDTGCDLCDGGGCSDGSVPLCLQICYFKHIYSLPILKCAEQKTIVDSSSCQNILYNIIIIFLAVVDDTLCPE